MNLSIESVRISELDQKYIWHPFTQKALAGPALPVKSAAGAEIFLEDGNVLIDGISSWWVNIHGHAHPKIADAIYHQSQTLEHIIFAGFTHEPAVRLAEKLVQHAGSPFSKVFYSDNGSTSVEVALKMAIQFFRNRGQINRRKILAFEGAYHGDTFGAMSVGERNAFNEAFAGYMFETVYIPFPEPGKESESLSAFKNAADEHSAAFIFEPLVQGTAGMRMYTPELLDEMIAYAQLQGIICIADEVMTGFGRTGRLFAKDYLHEKPDILCLSKGITGGFLPLGATLVTDCIYESFVSTDMRHTFYHGHSYTANPISCAAAFASMVLLESPECLEGINRITQSHFRFKSEIDKLIFSGDIRCLGTIMAIELHTDAPTSYFHFLRDELYQFFIDRGVLLRPLGNILYIMPPYCITDEQLSRIYRTVHEALIHFNFFITDGRPVE